MEKSTFACIIADSVKSIYILFEGWKGEELDKSIVFQKVKQLTLRKKYQMKKTALLVALSFCLLGNKVKAQDTRVITTAVPFLMITPNSKAAAMGEAGVATTPDANSMFWNASKLAFVEKDAGISISYAPWLQNLVDDVNLTYISGFYRLNDKSTLGASLKYFSLGSITFRESAEVPGYHFNPNEYAFDVGYALQLSKRLSGGLAFRFIYSDLLGNTQSSSGDAASEGTSLAADISAYYTSKTFDLQGKDARYKLGLNISNIGNKITYSTSGDEDFIPANLRIGSSLEIDIDEYNAVNFALDFNKLLVPTPPLNSDEEDPFGDTGVIEGVFNSFSDAPAGDSELREINVSLGAEYWYNKQFAFRGGYFYEHETKGNRQYLTFGAGLKMQVLSIDVSYLVPTTTDVHNPLKNTIRFSLNFDLDAFRSSSEG